MSVSPRHISRALGDSRQDCGRFPASDRRRTAGLDRGACARNSGRAGGAARRRQDHAGAAGAGRRGLGAKTAASWCSSRAGSPRAPPPSAWRRRSASASARRSGLRVRFGSKVSRRTRIEIITEGIFTRLILDDPMLDGVAAVLFDEFHERSLDADLGLALARDVQQGLREDLRLLVMSATIDGARVAGLLGDAPVIESEGRAFPVETRYVGRDARPIEPQVADTIVRAMRAETGSLLAFLPGAAEIRRTQTLLEGRADAVDRRRRALRRARRRRAGPRHRAGPARPPQDRAGDLDRRDLDHHRGRAHRRRLRARARAALRARCRRDAARNRARVARRRRSAPRPRRPHRARHLLPAVGRAADRRARAVRPAGNPRRRSVVLRARSRRLGQRRRTSSPFSIRRRAPALAEAKALLAELGAIDGDGRITDEGRRLRRLPLPPRLARMVVDAAARRRRACRPPRSPR